MERLRVLVSTDFYLPGFKGGGRLRTLANLVERLGDDVHFSVVAQDRDFGDDRPYQGVLASSWQRVGKADVYYLPSSSPAARLRTWQQLLTSTPHDVLYLNGFFPQSTYLPLLLRRIGHAGGRPVVVAPRGEFSPAALRLKRWKKRPYLALTRRLGLYGGVTWQGSSALEADQIRQCLGNDVTVAVAPDLPTLDGAGRRAPRAHRKVPGRLRIVFLSRVARMKNLDGALTLLRGMPGDIEFDVYGPLEDQDYWSLCKRLAEDLPSNVRVRYRGPVDPQRVVDVLSGYDLFFLPTLGENFGYVILEAMLAGCPVLVSDRTPWRGLARDGAGWDVPLDQPAAFRAVLRQCLDMDETSHRAHADRARQLGLRQVRDATAVQQNLSLFRTTAIAASEDPHPDAPDGLTIEDRLPAPHRDRNGLRLG